MLIQKIRADTLVEHAALQAALNILDPKSTLSEYIETIQIFEAFVALWEETGDTACPPRMRAAFLERKRAKLLQDDLAYFHAPRLRTPAVMPSFESPLTFLGAMYVMEGSTLGGQVISRHLESAFSLSDGRGYSFFRGHGSETVTLWKSFSALLEEQVKEGDQEAVASGARQMFTAFHSWIDQCRQVSRDFEQPAVQASR